MEGETLMEAMQTPHSVDMNQAELGSQKPPNGGQLVKRESLSSIKHPLSPQCPQHGDYLPKDLLDSLANPFSEMEDLRPQGNGQLKRGRAFPKVYPKRPPDNVWNHSKTREKFKHLTEQPPCTCGAGRDISFLYDATVSEQKSRSPGKESRKKTRSPKVASSKSTPDPDAQRQSEKDETLLGITKDGSLIPDTLIPSEFHIVKNPGVMGIEIHDEKYTTVTDNHEKHLTLFPSLKPSGRQEAKQLKKTMEDLLKRLGVDENKKKDTDQPTQIHSLLELVKQEQNIYNIVFNEVIRQVSIECVERGELLAELRKRYAKLLDRIPRQVKSLHEEVLAQRALDRRLTEELTRFKSSITLLTRELHEVQDHDREVTRQAMETQNELNAALKESEKNASLLAEYHELYELQRKRLEFQIARLMEERDLWSGASYSLSLKVAKRHNLKTARRLHLHEKAWYKLSSHFASSLSDIDTTQLQELTNHVQSWQDVAEQFDNKLLRYEKESYRKLQHIRKQVNHWGDQFLRVVTPDEGTVHPPEKILISKLHEDMKRWEEVINSEIERFSGDVLLSCEDDLIKMSKMVDDWSDVASKIFRRHPTSDGSQKPERQMMSSLNHDVEKLHKEFRLRMTGENGLAKGLIHFINVFDSLTNKLNAFSNGGEIMLDPEWVRLADYLQSEWDEVLTELIELVTPEDEEEEVTESHSAETQPGDPVLNVSSLSKLAQKWLTETTNSVENSDAGILDHVSSSHSNMVRWMVTVLLRLAPNIEEDPLEEVNNNEEDTFNSGIGAAIVSESTIDEIKYRAKTQFKKLFTLTTSLYNCCKGFVNHESNVKHDDMSEMEVKDLKKMKGECEDWIKTAVILVHEISGEIIEVEEIDEKFDEKGFSASDQDDIATKKGESMKSQVSSLSDGGVSVLSKEDSELLNKEKKDSTEDRKSSQQKDTSSETANEKPAPQSDPSLNGNVTGTDGKVSETVDENAEDKGTENPEESKEKIEMHVIGQDDNVRTRSLDELSMAEGTSSEVDRDGSPPEKQEGSSTEALATITKLQGQLVDTEERAQILEERAISAETQLKEAQERIRALERSVRRSSQDSTCSSKRPTTGRLSAASTLLESESDTPVPDKSPSNSRPATGK